MKITRELLRKYTTHLTRLEQNLWLFYLGGAITCINLAVMTAVPNVISALGIALGLTIAFVGIVRKDYV